MKARANTLSRLGLVGASGLSLALAFPKFDLNLLAWVAFVPLLYAVDDLPLSSVFAYSWIQGLICYLPSLYWIVITLHDFAGLNRVLACGPLLLLAAVLALYTGLAMWVSYFVARRLNLSLLITLPLAWVAVEWIRSRNLPIGFPWNLLGYAAYRNLELIQFAEFTGVFGISALIILFNTVIFVMLSAPRSPKLQVWTLSALTGVMIAAAGFGAYRIRAIRSRAPLGKLRVAMVQGNVPQSIKWDPRFLAQSFDIYAGQTELAAKHGADLILWPEAAAEFFFQPKDAYPAQFAEDAAYRARLLELAKRAGDPILFGAPALGVEQGRLGSYNRAYLVSARGEVVDYYDKIQLVPFGEYVPARAMLGRFVNRVVEGFGDMLAGRRRTVFEAKGARLGVLICYESVFPDLTRRFVKGGADLLVNITNDAWYGTSSAPYQLLAMAAMRSVETKVAMVRVANTGISAVIKPDGAITARTPLFSRGTEIEDVYYRPELTFYARFGDVFSYLCLALMAGATFAGWIWPRRRKPAEVATADLMQANGHGRPRRAVDV